MIIHNWQHLEQLINTVLGKLIW